MSIQLADTELSYYALALCILSNRSVETSFHYLTGGSMRLREPINPEDLIRLKQTMTYAQIGELYGLHPTAIYSKIRYFKKKQKQREAMKCAGEMTTG